MKKKDGGFTLIELLIALAVLSIMAGVLLQPFVLSRRMNTKAGKDELILDAAKRTMEELKGYPFEELEKFLSEEGGTSGGAGKIMIGGTLYQLERLEDIAESAAEESVTEESVIDENEGRDWSLETGRGYRLTAEYGRKLSGEGKADYIICADADFERYSSLSDENQDTSYSINQYHMPNIADVSSFQNVVVEPQTLMKDNELLTAELLLKVNPGEDTDEGEGGADSGDEEGEEEVYDESDVKRYLTVTVSETSGSSTRDGEKGILTVQVQAAYTVDDTVGENRSGDLSIVTNLASFQKNIVREKEKGNPENRVYLFLPDGNTRYVWPAREKETLGEAEETETETSGFPGYDAVFIRTEDMEEQIEFYLIAASEEQDKVTNLVLPSAAEENFAFFSNLEGYERVSHHEAENRLYHLTVTVFEAVYKEGENDGKPMLGRELLKLDSTKSE